MGTKNAMRSAKKWAISYKFRFSPKTNISGLNTIGKRSLKKTIMETYAKLHRKTHLTDL